MVEESKGSPDEELPLTLKFVEGEILEAQTEGKSFELAAKQHMMTKRVRIESIKELRQNTVDGSTLEVFFDTTGLTYKTA